MKPSQAKALIDDCIKRGWVRNGNRVHTPAEAAALNIKPDKPKRLPKAKRTGWIDDELNIRNKARHTSAFIRLVKIELGLECWPEFYFTTERDWRFDNAIPVDAAGKVLKIAIEIEGGIHTNGRHTRGTGYANDMEKYSMASVHGWTLIRCTPDQVDRQPGKIIELIKQAIKNKK